MNSSANKIVGKFPFIKQQVKNFELEKEIEQSEVEKFTEFEKVFFRLACSFIDPDRISQDIMKDFYTLGGDLLEFALEVFFLHFKQDTYLMPNTPYALINTKELLNQTDLAEFLTDKGLNFTLKKVNTYHNRGKLFDPEVYISGKPFWTPQAADKFAKDELLKQKIVYGNDTSE